MSGKHYYPEIKDVFLKPGDKVLMDYGEVTVRSITHDDRGYDDFTFLDSEDLVCRVGDMLVKYLDQEDIESLGFEYTGGLKEELNFNALKNEAISITYKASSKELSISNADNDDIYYTLFQGTVKNKSELERVLEMIGYGQ